MNKTVKSHERIVLEIADWVKHNSETDDGNELTIGLTTPLLEEGLLDSMQLLELLNWMEAKYAISVGVENLTAEFFSTPGAIAEQVLLLQTSQRK